MYIRGLERLWNSLTKRDRHSRMLVPNRGTCRAVAWKGGKTKASIRKCWGLVHTGRLCATCRESWRVEEMDVSWKTLAAKGQVTRAVYYSEIEWVGGPVKAQCLRGQHFAANAIEIKNEYLADVTFHLCLSWKQSALFQQPLMIF